MSEKTFNAAEISWAEKTPDHIRIEWHNRTSLKSKRLSLIAVICAKRQAESNLEQSTTYQGRSMWKLEVELWGELTALIFKSIKKQIAGEVPPIPDVQTPSEDHQIARHYAINFQGRTRW